MRIYLGPYEDDRKEEIHIDPWDTWSLDYTLAKIILPCLIQLKETNHGAGFIYNEDVPKYLHSPTNSRVDIDQFWFDRWNYVIDEMMWTFSKIIEDPIELISNKEMNERVNNGLRLFGKYYRSLWD